MGNKVESRPKTGDEKIQLQAGSEVLVEIQTKTLTPLQSVQGKLQNSSKTQKDEFKMNSKKFGLVVYEVAKQDNSIFSDEQKLLVHVSFVGVFLSLAAATLINTTQLISKPSEKYKKLIFIAGVGNLLASVIFGGYGVYHVIDMATKVPEEQWARIEADKEQSDKMSFSEKKQLFMKQLEEKQARKNSETFIEKQRKGTQQKQEKIDLIK